MRHARLLVLSAIAALLTAGPARAQEPGGQSTQIDFGFRATNIDATSDRARFERYRDLRDGWFLDRVRFERETNPWNIEVQADHVGYRDQRYSLAFDRYGKLKALFEWNQTPLFYSQDASWLYADQGGGELRIGNAAVRAGIQNGSLKIANGNQFLGAPFDLQQRRDTAAFGIVAAVAKDADLSVKLTSSRMFGAMPWGASFGLSAANEIAAPIDHRTNDIGVALEWASDKSMARLGYDGSWFSNRIPTLVYDSPFKLTDSTNATAYVSGNGTSQGRSAMWPDSMANTVSAAAAHSLPGRTRLNGSLSIGNWTQNANLLPYTINTAIPVIPLDRQTAQAEALITAFNVNLSSRPTNLLWLNVRARRYDYDNRTPEFHVADYVRVDQTAVASLIGHSEPFGYVRNFLDADASFTPLRFTSFKVGYGVEKDHRTFRYLESTLERTFRAAIDTSGNPYVTFRLGYEHAKRTGTGFDEEAFDDIGEQISLRQYDISDRNRDRVTALVQITPIGPLAVIASAQVGRDSRPNANFGLRQFDTDGYSIGVDAAPHSSIQANLTYGVDSADSTQKSRQANPGDQFNDPRRDWFADVNDRVHYLTGNLDLVKTIPRTDIKVAIDWNKSHTAYPYSLPSNTTLATPVPLPRVENELRGATVDVRYFLTRRVAAGFVYAYDSFAVDDFAMSPNYVIGNRTLVDGITLGYFLRPYTAHTGWFRLTYFW